PAERANPDIINPSRKRRIAAGSGRQVEDVNRLLSQFRQLQKLFKQMNGGGKNKKQQMKRMAMMQNMKNMGGFKI
nr:signal recognition particle protein [Clostridiales bacterium]